MAALRDQTRRSRHLSLARWEHTEHSHYSQRAAQTAAHRQLVEPERFARLVEQHGHARLLRCLPQGSIAQRRSQHHRCRKRLGQRAQSLIGKVSAYLWKVHPMSRGRMQIDTVVAPANDLLHEKVGQL
jgi:hypothetical protein